MKKNYINPTFVYVSMYGEDVLTASNPVDMLGSWTDTPTIDWGDLSGTK